MTASRRSRPPARRTIAWSHYAGGDKLFLPVENIELLTRYGSEQTGPARPAGRRGLAVAQGAGQGAHARDRRGAHQVAAERQIRQGEQLRRRKGSMTSSPPASPMPRPRTSSGDRRPWRTGLGQADGPPDLRRRRLRQDRGRAARRVRRGACAGMQVAVVVPTTLLAVSISGRSSERFAGLPVKVASSRGWFPQKRRREIKRDLPRATIDIVVGTHALLGKGSTSSVSASGRRRGAAFRRQAEGTAEAAEEQRARSDADGDADPADPAAGALSGVREM